MNLKKSWQVIVANFIDKNLQKLNKKDADLVIKAIDQFELNPLEENSVRYHFLFSFVKPI